ncbi:MAG: Asp-tRNA(Asn)/Glu-tRNA(Gln) amidotransferase subunit GatB [Oscillospiraceae bacterium]|nr:Asp-tRNA(Asn)/Glu-tRNA(Gln) amidotransferase subunit GatB [Oscillospiraceae bacterium]
MKLYPTIGLETHAELMTESKLFCSCSARFGGGENEHCCIGCSGFPGALPALNKKALELIVRAGFSFNCEIARFTKWERKNYFYPDLPAAYQVSQMERPVCAGGFLEINVSGEKKTIRLNRIHLEEDAGKLTHEGNRSFADYNRTGVPLIEIVTEPDFHSADEVVAYVEKLRQILQYADICDGKMEQGSLRCDVNISLATIENTQAGKLGVRTEIKNLNSIKAIGRAIQAETERQTDIIESGGTVVQQTLRFNDANGEITPMRNKENAHDYRYFPDPDIPPVVLTEEELKSFKAALPELPEVRMSRYTAEFGLSPNDAAIILGDKNVSDFYDDTVKIYNSPKTLAGFIIVELLRRVNLGEANMKSLSFTADDFAELQRFVDEGKVNRDIRKDILRDMLESGKSPVQICDEKNLWIKEDAGAVEAVIDKIMAANPAAVEQYKNGEIKVFGFLMGQANKELKGSAAPATVKNMLEQKLKKA